MEVNRSSSTKEFSQQNLSFVDLFLIDDAGLSKEMPLFAGVRCNKNGNLSIHLPYGLAHNSKAIKALADIEGNRSVLEKELREAFFLLLKVLNDRSLINEVTSQNPDFKEIQDFPMQAYVDILDYFLNYGYFVEPILEYKKSTKGKINWHRTIKTIPPKLIESKKNVYSVVYLDYITRNIKYRDDHLISLIYKYCVRDASKKKLGNCTK